MNESGALAFLVHIASLFASFSSVVMCGLLYRRTRRHFLLAAISLFSSFFLMTLSMVGPRLLAAAGVSIDLSGSPIARGILSFAYSSLIAGLFIYGLLDLVFALVKLDSSRLARRLRTGAIVMACAAQPLVSLAFPPALAVQVFNIVSIWIPSLASIILAVVRHRHYLGGLYHRERMLVLALSIINLACFVPGFFFPAAFALVPFVFIICLSILVHHVANITWFAPQIEASSANTFQRASKAFIDSYGISPREADVLNAILAGKQNKAIADELCISIKTVETHLGNLYRKTGTAGRLALFSLLQKD